MPPARQVQGDVVPRVRSQPLLSGAAHLSGVDAPEGPVEALCVGQAVRLRGKVDDGVVALVAAGGLVPVRETPSVEVWRRLNALSEHTVRKPPVLLAVPRHHALSDAILGLRNAEVRVFPTLALPYAEAPSLEEYPVAGLSRDAQRLCPRDVQVLALAVVDVLLLLVGVEATARGRGDLGTHLHRNVGERPLVLALHRCQTQAILQVPALLVAFAVYQAKFSAIRVVRQQRQVATALCRAHQLRVRNEQIGAA